MIGIGFLVVLSLGAYGAIQWIQTNRAIRQQLANRANVPGISVYQPIQAPNRLQQVYAPQIANPDQSVETGLYVPALGPFENRPQNGGVIF